MRFRRGGLEPNKNWWGQEEWGGCPIKEEKKEEEAFSLVGTTAHGGGRKVMPLGDPHMKESAADSPVRDTCRLVFPLWETQSQMPERTIATNLWSIYWEISKHFRKNISFGFSSNPVEVMQLLTLQRRMLWLRDIAKIIGPVSIRAWTWTQVWLTPNPMLFSCCVCT